MIEIKNITKKFGGITALDNISFKIEKEKITAIIGPNGSGKSTLFHVISHLIEADRGEILLDGHEIQYLPDYWIASLGISRTFQEVRLFKNLTIAEHIEIAISKNDQSLFKSLFKKEISNNQYDNNNNNQNNNGSNNSKKIKEIIAFVGLEKPLNTIVTELSYGQRKLLDLAVAIAKPHQLLMLDEPVAGVNPALREKIKQVIRELQKKGETIIIIEHDMNFVMDLADYIFVMDYGELIAEGLPKEIQNNKKVLDAYLGN